MDSSERIHTHPALGLMVPQQELGQLFVGYPLRQFWLPLHCRRRLQLLFLRPIQDTAHTAHKAHNDEFLLPQKPFYAFDGLSGSACSASSSSSPFSSLATGVELIFCAGALALKTSSPGIILGVSRQKRRGRHSQHQVGDLCFLEALFCPFNPFRLPHCNRNTAHASQGATEGKKLRRIGFA